MDEELDDPGRAWLHVDAELTRRAKKHQTPADWHALGRELGVARNTANNWRARERLPSHQWQQVADYFGWSLDRLLGRQESAPTGSPDEPGASPIHGASISFSRDDFLRAYDKLTPPQTQMLARLMAAVGFVPGVTVEVIPRWTAPTDSQKPVPPDSYAQGQIIEAQADDKGKKK